MLLGATKIQSNLISPSLQLRLYKGWLKQKALHDL